MYEESNLRVHVAFIGYHVNRIIVPLKQRKADKVYLVNHANDNEKAREYVKMVFKILQKEQYIQVEKRTADIWNLFECLNIYREIMKQEKQLYINVSVGTKISAIGGILACMLYGKGIPYYAHIDYNKEDNKKEPSSKTIGNEAVTVIEDLPVYPIGMPKPESLTLLKILSQAPDKKLKKHTLIEKLEEARIIDNDKKVSQAAKHSRLKSLLNPMAMDYPPQILQRRVEVENKGRQSNVILTKQGENTLRIFGEQRELDMKKRTTV